MSYTNRYKINERVSYDISQDAIDAIEYLTDDARIEIAHAIRQHLK